MNLTDKSLFKTATYINGEWLSTTSKAKTFDVTDPATGETIAEVADCGREEVIIAVKAAKAAWPEWRAKTAKERATILRNWYNLIMDAKEDLAIIMTTEQGKPLFESRGEIAYGASFIEWFAEEGKRIYGDIIPTHARGKAIHVTKQPIGITAAVTPWNFPSAMITRKCAPALAAGCPVIIKPAQATPLSALALAELADRAGIPKGIFNIITSDCPKDIGNELCTNPDIRKFSFTGSTSIGKKLMADCASTVKKVSLELGGNAPFIVFDDADIDDAIEGAMAAKYRNSGQTCVCANRMLIQEGIYEKFIKKLKIAVENLTLGHGLKESTSQGPLINQAAIDSVSTHVKDALEKGARLITGGKPHKTKNNSYFYEPTILADVTSNMKVTHEEIFGPVAPIYKFKTEKEAIEMANNTQYGLAAYFYSRDIGIINRVAEALEYGIIGINEGIISTEVAPFGGIKESGIGREGSKYGIEDFTEIKYHLIGGLDK